MQDGRNGAGQVGSGEHEMEAREELFRTFRISFGWADELEMS